MARRERQLEDVLGGALNAGPVPADGRRLVEYAGGRRALTEQLSGLPGPPRRGDYRDPERYETDARRWRSSSQAALRYSKGARSPKIAPAQKSRVRRAANAAKRATIQRRGLRTRLYARVRVDSPGKRGGDERDRQMPSGGPGVYIGPSEVTEVLDDLGNQEIGDATEEFAAAFLASYGFPDAEIVSVTRLKVWPEGTAEPA